MLTRKKVVTCFLESDNKILILRRSGKVGTYQGRWAGVSGYLEKPTAEGQALTEIMEETGLSFEDIELIKIGKPLHIKDEKIGVEWIVHPFLFHVKDPGKIRIDWEHRETKWIKPEELIKFETVPKLKETLERVIKLKEMK